jgi:hypothetical protein
MVMYYPVRHEFKVIYGPSNVIHPLSGMKFLDDPARTVYTSGFEATPQTARLIEIAETKSMPSILAENMPAFILPLGILGIIASYDVRTIVLTTHHSHWSGELFACCDITGLEAGSAECRCAQAAVQCIECPTIYPLIAQCHRADRVCELVAWNTVKL